MEICMQKIAMIRPDFNPKNLSLNLDMDWSIEFSNTDQNQINFNIILKSLGEFRIDFKVEGIVILYEYEEFLQNDLSQIIFHQACSLLLDMISLTREYSVMDYCDSKLNALNTAYN